MTSATSTLSASARPWLVFGVCLARPAFGKTALWVLIGLVVAAAPRGREPSFGREAT